MRKVNKFQCIIIAFLLGLIAVFVGGGGIASADNNSGYSNAIDDLQKDKNFNVWDYPAVPNDYKLEVIQIAESKAGELFIYVYQPSGAVADLRSTCVNMALSEDVNGTDFYNLKYVNSSGVFYKYIVEGVKVSSASERFYNITSILREWNEDYDAPSGNDNVINEVPFEVGQLWKATTANGKVTYECFKKDFVEVTSKWCSYLLYPNGYYLTFQSNVASFFVAFDYDLKIDGVSCKIENLYEAELTYTTREFQQVIKNGTPQPVHYGPVSEPVKKSLYCDNYNTFYSRGWLFGKTVTWKAIQSKDEFMKEEKNSLSDYAKTQLADKKWILRFYDTTYTQTHSADDWNDYVARYFTEVNNVSILRLKFETNGKVYNLGVVDNKQSGSIFPANNDGGLEWWEILLIVIAVVVVLSLALKILSLFVPFFGVLLQGLLFIITSPFRLIIWIVKKIRGE